MLELERLLCTGGHEQLAGGIGTTTVVVVHGSLCLDRVLDSSSSDPVFYDMGSR